MTTVELDRLLLCLGACDEAREWVAAQPDAPRVWQGCRGDWMLWLAARLGVAREVVVLAACRCARLALGYVPAGEERPRKAIEAAEAWTRGEATAGEVRVARDAFDAVDAPYTAAAPYTSAARYAAYAACYAADDYVGSFAVAASVVGPFVASASAGNRAAVLQECADIVRQLIPFEEFERLCVEAYGREFP